MLHPYSCLLVDDEQAAHYVLQHYISRVPYLSIVGTCYSAMDALRFLHGHPVDILFLDMEMPEVSGLELLKSLPHLPKTILTTAYTDYALIAYDYGVTDYLLKPFEFSRFLKAVHRATGTSSLDYPAEQPLLIKVDGGQLAIPISEISHIQSIGNYARIVTTKDQSHLTLITLTKIEETLPKETFLRIHKSYVVNMQQLVDLSEREVTLTLGVRIPIGITYKRKLMDFWNQYHGKNPSNR